VLNQLAGLLDRGVALDLYAERRGREEGGDLDEGARRLSGCATYFDVPDAYAPRVRSAARLFRARWREAPATWMAALNTARYGVEAASLRLLHALGATTGRGRYDVVHSHFGPMGLVGARLCDLGALTGPLLTTFYGYDVSRRRYIDAYRFLFQRGDLFIAVSEHMRQRLLALGAPPKRVIVHSLGVDVERFRPAAQASPRAAAVTIVSVSRFVAKKGLEDGLRAVARVVRGRPGLRYVLAGDGPLRARLEALSVELGLSAVVRFCGWQGQDAVAALLREADLLLAPSVTAADGDTEGTPVVLLEALASGVPVVATHHAGIPEIVAEGVHGLLAPEGDVPALAEAVRTLLDSPGLARQMGRSGREAACARHDIRRLNERLLEIYSGV
jgi:colanic acid/amylovoran biosynthesis glycosyltransferase